MRYVEKLSQESKTQQESPLPAKKDNKTEKKKENNNKV